MSFLSTDELKTLIEQSQGVCVSIYMPTVWAGTETQQNPIRFKNLIREVESKLQEFNLRKTDISGFLQPALDLDQENFWQHQDKGLAIFVADGFFRYYYLPMPVQESAIVSDRFYLKPLIPLLTEDSEFYILALSQQKVKLFEASRYSIQEVQVEGMPTSLEAALQYDETAKEGQFRISTSKGGTNNSFQQSGVFHGQGSPDRDQHQKDILEFFHLVNDAVMGVLRGKNAPLVLDAVEYLVPLYQEANTYQFILDGYIHTENIDVATPEDLHDRALPLMEPFFNQTREAALQYYQNMTGTGKTSTNIQEAVSAAYYGRVEQLFVDLDRQQWGHFDPQANELQIHTEAELGDEDLIDAAAVQTLLNGGKVFAVESDQVPGAAPIAAVFRY